MELSELREEIVTDLTNELSIADDNFNPELLESKVRGAIREVLSARRYPRGYSEDAINEDMANYYSQIRNIALYDYNLIGNEGQKVSSENGISRTFVDRSSLFVGVLPIARRF